MRKKFLVFTVVALLVGLLGNANAAAITGFNTDRPFGIGLAVPAGSLTVQQMLTALFGTGISATDDQQKAGVWQSVSPPPYSAVTSLLAFEFANSQAGNNMQEFGVWTGYDTTGTITTHAVFNGVANPSVPPTTATMTWNDATSGQISGTGTGVNVGAFSGIAANFFGFYYKYGDNATVYTYDGLNSGNVASLAYMAPSGAAWAIFFEGGARLSEGADNYDFNEMVVKVESITTVPEPMTLLLLGLGLLGVAGIRRKFKG